MKDTALKLFKIKILPLVAAVVSVSAISVFSGTSTTNIFPLLFLIAFYNLFKSVSFIKEKKVIIVSNVLGVIYTISLVFTSLSYILSLSNITERIGTFILYCVGFYFLFKNIIAFLCLNLLKRYVFMDWKYTKKRSVILFFIFTAVMLLCWLPYFLKDFPANVTSDSNTQLLQAIGKEPLSNHHPVAHTLVIRLFFKLGMLLFNNQNLALATYSVCQAILLSMSFAFLLITMYKYNVNKIIMAVTLVFYAVTPYHAVYSMTMWKDIWFGGIVLVLTTTIWRVIKHFEAENKNTPIFETVLLLIFGVAMCLFRSNGWYAYLVFAPFVFFVFKKKSLCIALTALAVIPIAFIVKGPIYNSLNVIEVDTIESLSIPAQHIARAITDGAELTDEQEALLSEVVDISEIPNRYQGVISNPIKNLVRETDNQDFIDKNKGKFLKLWIDLGIKNPKSYLMAQIDQTYGYWYPDVQYWVIAEEFSNTDMDYYRDPILPQDTVEEFNEYVNSYRKIPLYGLLWSIGAFTWVFIFSGGLCYIKQKNIYLIMYIPMLAILGTLIIATPVYAEFRYIYPIFTTMPLFLAAPFVGYKSKENIEKEI